MVPGAMTRQPTTYYSDSRVFLELIKSHSTKEPLKRYVVSRLQFILRVSSPDQWHYIPTEINPADLGTRPISVKNLQASCWLKGPAFLFQEDPSPPESPTLQLPSASFFTHASSYFTSDTCPITEDVTSGSAWKKALREAQQQKHATNDIEATMYLLKQMQSEAWPKGLNTINHLEPRKRSELLTKSPFIDESDGLLKVGGRLARADLSFGRKHPVLIPALPLGDALLGFIHANTQHQGRKIFSSAIREAGYCPIGGRRRTDHLVATCMPCRILRAPLMSQKMADLPAERLYRTPPFYHCGIDVFGPFNIRHGKATRGSPGVQKVWVLIFSCLYSRAVHLETLDSMDTSSFKLAFHRFQSLRGECAYLRSDAGSNFVGARNEEMSRDSQQLDKDVQSHSKK